MTDNRTTEKPNCDGCSIKKIYAMRQECRSKASKLARETVKAAREQRVDIGELIKYIANEYAASCSTYASYDGYTYYASGIRLQAIADELNARAGRTCEEIVRCRDCEHYDETEVNTWEFERRKMPTCGRFASFLHGTQPDGYCAWGVRKEVGR